MSLRQIIYTSQASEQFNKRSLLDLLHTSRGYNTIDNISGVLMHRDGYFLQIIEGEQDVIEDLFQRLNNDTRHKNIKMILDRSVESRLFSNWAMGCADFDEPELSMLPGIRTDLSNPEVIEDLIIHLPEIADFLLDKLD
ncbi:FAD-dependent sensor of blue light [Winogradskyella eximia]|jgi:Sensors of blue-light using FAD|uniref:FAD-dependent sensor of blue light n=1 Tax=Winogradskyella eximia TaxID=262006 RepID=A0A3D9H365_9FLAO|nr:BLUF domain-containing protein [Winogradskyella eximia]RED43955.1 FAD-dependent sensor of blue light [Winogradskyella eximia]|tara:strand:- start:2122 stop:2538 length:417 start_codon:yes stop_codon:yes gene_type:complete